MHLTLNNGDLTVSHVTVLNGFLVENKKLLIDRVSKMIHILKNYDNIYTIPFEVLGHGFENFTCSTEQHLIK